jgi:hypothetical protein
VELAVEHIFPCLCRAPFRKNLGSYLETPRIPYLPCKRNVLGQLKDFAIGCLTCSGMALWGVIVLSMQIPNVIIDVKLVIYNALPVEA